MLPSLVFFAFRELLGCGSLQEEKANQNFVMMGVLLFSELEEKKTSRNSPLPPKKRKSLTWLCVEIEWV